MLLAQPRMRMLGVALVGVLAAGCGAEAEADATSVATATVSPSSTASPNASAPATGSPDVSAPEGWERHESVEGGFAISLPRGWEAVDLSTGDIEDIVGFLRDDPRTAPIADQLPAMMEQGVAFFAVQIDPESLESGFATNLNIVVQQDVGMSLEMYAAGNISFVEETFNVDVVREEVTLAVGDAIRVDYETTFTGTPLVHQTQFYLVDDDRALIATFSRAADDGSANLDEEFVTIIDTLELLP